MSVTVRARGLSKAYRDGSRKIDVLRGADLDVAAGEFVAVVGPSGCGKSTLLHLLGGLDRPDGGTVTVADQDLAQLNGTEMAGFRNRTVGFIFQFQELLSDFSALENVILPGRIRGEAGRALEKRGLGLLEEVGLLDRAADFPGELSGGERQRVALCRALLLDPPLLLADEPTGSLDPESGDLVFELMLRLQKRHGTTALVVTHNRELAKRCGRVLQLAEGRLAPQ